MSCWLYCVHSYSQCPLAYLSFQINFDLNMPRNVEIKAVVRNLNRIRGLAQSLCSSEGEVLIQDDSFYKVSTGRLKLRRFQVRCC